MNNNTIRKYYCKCRQRKTNTILSMKTKLILIIRGQIIYYTSRFVNYSILKFKELHRRLVINYKYKILKMVKEVTYLL